MKDVRVLVFDVTETLLDLASLRPLFAQHLGDAGLLRTWFDEVIVYAEALTLAGLYEDAGAVGLAVFEMLAATRNVGVDATLRAAFRAAAAAPAAYPDVLPGLRQLLANGHRAVALSNGPRAACAAQLAQAGLGGLFEQVFSIDDTVRRYKPAPETYLGVAQALGLAPAALCLVSCHAFDVLGARAAGLRAVLVTRPGNAPFGLGPPADLVVPDLAALAETMASRG